jgi:hypothetical protein
MSGRQWRGGCLERPGGRPGANGPERGRILKAGPLPWANQVWLAMQATNAKTGLVPIVLAHLHKDQQWEGRQRDSGELRRMGWPAEAGPSIRVCGDHISERKLPMPRCCRRRRVYRAQLVAGRASIVARGDPERSWVGSPRRGRVVRPR